MHHAVLIPHLVIVQKRKPHISFGTPLSTHGKIERVPHRSQPRHALPPLIDHYISSVCFIIRHNPIFPRMIHLICNWRTPEHPLHKLPVIPVCIVPPQLGPRPNAHIEIPAVKPRRLRLSHPIRHPRHHGRPILYMTNLLPIVNKQIARWILRHQQLIIPVQHRIKLKTHPLQ